MSLWLAARPLMLASKSAARRALLEAAGIPVEIEPGGYRRARGRGARRPRRCRDGRGAAGAGEGAGGGGEASRSHGARRRPDAGARRAAVFQGGRSRRRPRAAFGLARQDPYAAFRRGGGGGRHCHFRARRCRASDDARVLGRLSRPLSRCGRGRGDRERRRLSARRRWASNCSSASRAIISPCSACRCCRCWTGCGAPGHLAK